MNKLPTEIVNIIYDMKYKSEKQILINEFKEIVNEWLIWPRCHLVKYISDYFCDDCHVKLKREENEEGNELFCPKCDEFFGYL